MSFFSDVTDSAAFRTAADDTVAAVARVKRAVDVLTEAVHGLDVRGDFAVAWRQAISRFDETSLACKRDCEQLAEAVRAHGGGTDAASSQAADAFTHQAKAAEGLV